ncbi:hypothetical protein [Paenibacillus sp. GXUN7292]|uniref:hypothetical protein n=1 Tax=Paenibacillus sp. GXUN7292 TaxID=3422499 RepID=UPI003D7CD830
MKSKLVKAGIVVATSALLLQPGIILQGQSIVHANSISVSKQVINLNSSSTISLQNAQLLTQDQGRVIAYSFVITNNGNKELSLSDFWVRLSSNSNKSFSTKISEQDKNIKAVAPKTSKIITYYSFVDEKAKLSDFKFEIIQWDFSVASYERKLGTISYSKEPTADSSNANIRFGNVNLSTSAVQYSLTQDSNNAYLQINYKMDNKGNNVADLSNLSLFLQTDTNSVYPIDMTQFTGQVLQAKQQKLFTFYVTIPKSLVGKSVNLVSAIKEPSSGLFLPTASFKIPAIKDTTLTQASKTKVVYMAGEKINTFLDAASIEREGNESKISFSYAVRNVGKVAVDYPNLLFSLQTENGVMYPLSVNKTDSEKTKLLPQLREVVNISGSIPSSIDVSKAKLVVRAGLAEKSEGYVLGAYLFKTSQQAGAIGSSFKYGDYSIKLNSIQRMATTGDDFLVADFEITNSAGISKSVPNLEGYFMINGVKLNAESRKLNLDEQVSIAPKGTYDFAVYSEIPYTSKIDNITFVLTEKISGSDTSKVIYRYTGNSTSEIQSVAKNFEYIIDNTGRKAEAKLIRSQIYNGEKENYFYSEFELKNKEARSSVPTNLNGYLKDDKGLVIPVSFTQINQKIDPDGKVLISAWAKVKKDFEGSRFEFVIGQNIVESSDSEAQKNSIIIKPVKYQLTNSDNTSVQEGFKNIKFAGYDLTLDRVQAMLDVSGLYTVNGLKLNFDYTLSKDASYDYIAGNHNIMFEFVNQSNDKTTYTKQFSLGKPKEGEKEFAEAINRSFSFVMEDSEIQTKLNGYDNYVLNIYDVFEDAKILVATKELKWFQID